MVLRKLKFVLGSFAAIAVLIVVLLIVLIAQLT
jgi:hypothetical protein